jgi:hypothetical protein
MRTFDDSGLQFFLLFQTGANYFFWALNEEAEVPEHFDRLGPNLLVGRRTGFAFWTDPGQRKILAAVHREQVLRNTASDGPFDQLAENDAVQTHLARWMERAQPALRGRIDELGYYTDHRAGSRVALTCYGTYDAPDELLALIARAGAAPDPLRYFSEAGLR